MLSNPQINNPLQNYVTTGQTAPMSVDGIVVDRIYAATGVIDAVNTNTSTTYRDPITNQLNNTGQINLSNNIINSSFTSSVLDDVYNTGLALDFNFSQTTYLNHVSFKMSVVPCKWFLYSAPYGTTDFTSPTSPATQLYTGTIVEFNANYQQSFSIDFTSTYQFDQNTNLFLVINKTVNGYQYPIVLNDFLAKLVIQTKSDITISGSQINSLTVQNPLGFIETFTPSTNSLSNISVLGAKEATGGTNNNTLYWKSTPQPVQDSIVWFVVDLGWQQTLDRMFLDPLYVNQPFNLYYSDVYTNTTDGGSALTWYPVNKDFVAKRGVYELPIINTRYLKFEFTKLTAEVYDLPLDSVDRNISVFPDWLDTYFEEIEQSIPDTSSAQYNSLISTSSPNLNYNSSPVLNTQYGLTVNQLRNTGYGNANINPAGPNNVNMVGGDYAIVDPTTSYKTLSEIAGVGSFFNNATKSTFINRRFPVYGTHQYKNVFLNQTWHQAYFAGIKYLSFYSTTPNTQQDNDEFFDSFDPTTINGVSYPSANTIISGSATTATYSGGVSGYTGVTNKVLQTQNLKTVSSFNSFYFGALSTEWQEFLTTQQTLLQGSQTQTGVTINGASVSINTNNVSSINSYGYGIYTLSGTTLGSNYIQTQNTSSLNYLTSAMSSFATTSGWSGSNPTSTTISGLSAVSIPGTVFGGLNQSAYGEAPYASTSYGIPSLIPTSNTNYTFLLTSTGLNGSVTVSGLFYTGTSGTLVSGFGQSFTVAASGTQISYTFTVPTTVTSANFILTPNGTATFSNAGLFSGTSATFSNPLQLQNMRISAIARIYLPNTNNGTYTLTIYTNTGSVLATKSFNNLPVKTWVDLQLPYTIFNASSFSNGIYARLTQSFGQGEQYSLSMLGLFYNPVAYQYSIDGTNWYNITTGICDPTSPINLPASTQQIAIKATLLQDYVYINCLDIIPVYTQNPYYSSANIDYLGDPKYNELSTRKSVFQRPLFQLDTEPLPQEFNITNVLNISNPYQLS